MSESEQEEELITQISRGHCPDCNYRGFVLGPRGGVAQNIECGGCGKRFNVVTFGWSCIFAERISHVPATWKGTRS